MNAAIAGRVPGGRGVRIHHSGGQITAVEPYPQAPGRWLLPGMIDLQVNGYAGLDVNGPDLTRR
jgi:N-acetylglucosamine-6-phosphate deacetylase